MVLYVPNRNKCVILLSSMHHTAEIDDETGDKKKPNLITYYNGTKGGVDVVDSMCAEYTVARGTRRWPLCLFFAVMNIAALNAYVVLKANLVNMKRRVFLKELGKSLVKPYMAERAQQSYVTREIRLLASRLSGAAIEKKEDPEPGKRGRCHMCKDNKTKYYCKICKLWVCLTHAEMLCGNCVGN